MTYSARRVYWPSQEMVGNWVPATTNTAGSFDLATDGLLMCGAPLRGQTLLWTTTDLWTMTYIGGALLYSFSQAGKNCGIVSRHAFACLDTAAYWMGTNAFFVFDGYVKRIPCDVQDYVFGNFNSANATLVWCLANPQYGEVTWYYPSSAASWPDSYVTFNYLENHWVFGTQGRTCGLTHDATGTNPVLVDQNGVIYDHETGNARDSTAFLESGPLEPGDGDQIARIQRIVPDDKTLGDVQAKLYTSFFPDQPETLNGPYALGDPTSVRLTARQVRLRLEEAVAHAWRVGVVRLGAVLGGRR